MKIEMRSDSSGKVDGKIVVFFRKFKFDIRH